MLFLCIRGAFFRGAGLLRENIRDPIDNGQRSISPSHGAKSMQPKK
jgi:hypothetical protein